MIKILFLIITFVLLIIPLILNTKIEKFSNQICLNFSCINDNCAITKETRICKDGRRQLKNNNVQNCYFEKVVDPNNPRCVDFCVKTYTYEDNQTDLGEQNSIQKQFIDVKKHSYFSSKCNECIDNFYDRIKLLKN